MDERRRLRLARENRRNNIDALGQNPNLDSLLLLQLNYDSQTESMILRGDFSDAVQQQAWIMSDPSSNSPQKPAIKEQSQQQTIALPPGKDNTTMTEPPEEENNATDTQ